MQCWNSVVTIQNNVATLCCAKNRRCESSRVTSPYGNPESRKSEIEENRYSWALESGIQFKESGILLTIGIRNPSSTDKDCNLVPGIQNPRYVLGQIFFLLFFVFSLTCYRVFFYFSLSGILLITLLCYVLYVNFVIVCYLAPIYYQFLRVH